MTALSSSLSSKPKSDELSPLLLSQRWNSPAESLARVNFESDDRCVCSSEQASFRCSCSALVSAATPNGAPFDTLSCTRACLEQLRRDSCGRFGFRSRGGIQRASEEMSFSASVPLFLLMVDVDCNSLISVLTFLHDDCVSKHESVGSYFTRLCVHDDWIFYVACMR